MGRKSTGSNPSVFPESQVIPECLVLQYFQIHRSYQNAWSFSISRFTSRKSSFETQNGLLGLMIIIKSQIPAMNSCGWQFLNLKITNSCDEFVWLTNGWSFSISRYTSYTEMVGPSVFPEKQVIPKWLDFQYFQIHGSKMQVLRPQMDFLGLISSPKRLLNIF